MTTGSPTETIQIHRVYIKATPEAIWEAITEPDWTVQYGYAPLVEYELVQAVLSSACERGHEGVRLPGRDQRRRGD